MLTNNCRTCLKFKFIVPSRDRLQPLAKLQSSFWQTHVIWQSCPYDGKVHMVSQLFPVYPTAQANWWIRYIFILSFHVKNIYNLNTIRITLLTYAFLTCIVPLVPNTTYSSTIDSTTMFCVYFIHCQWKSRLKLTCQIHFTYLPHMLLDNDGIMMTKVTQKMLNLILKIILSEAIFTV